MVAISGIITSFCKHLYVMEISPTLIKGRNSKFISSYLQWQLLSKLTYWSHVIFKLAGWSLTSVCGQVRLAFGCQALVLNRLYFQWIIIYYIQNQQVCPQFGVEHISDKIRNYSTTWLQHMEWMNEWMNECFVNI